MYREIRILLIDDNEQRRRDLKVILDFVGEETFAILSESSFSSDSSSTGSL